MFIGILALLSALSISAVAIYYSVIGLATIFVGAFWPVVIMGTVLEVGKLITASWLYRHWKQTNFLLRTYLFLAVIILSIITSMGIFGFLSKAHLESEFAAGSKQQQIAIINTQIKTEESIIKRQQEVIDRAFGQGTTNTVRLEQLNERLKQLDKEVEAYTSQGTGFLKGDSVKKGLQVKEAQKEERALIDKEIREITGKSSQSTEAAEQRMAQSQAKILKLIEERQPLLAEQLAIEAEVGPIKYIAALAVDMGWAQDVNTASAVRWVIILLIVVFDPLAVLLLIAANQSLIRKFPVKEEAPKEIIDLEKPEFDPPVMNTDYKPAPPLDPEPKTESVDPAVDQWNSMIDRMNELMAKEQEQKQKKLEDEVKDWQAKLDKFNEKVEKPEPKDIEIVQQQPEQKDEDQIEIDFEFGEAPQEEVTEEVKEEVTEDEPTISEQIEEAMEQDRYKPDLTEVVETEKAVAEPKKAKVGMLGQVVVDKKNKPIPFIKDDFERTGTLNKFHQEHGKFQDVAEVELKEERDSTNIERFLEEVGITEQEVKDHPPITKSRMGFFQDYIDDIKRGDTEAENLPPEIAKTIAAILSEFKGPEILEPMANTAVEQTGLSTMTSSELAEQFQIEPETEDRDMTEEELDNLMKGFEQEDYKGEYDVVISGGKKIKVPKQGYKQNAEQSEDTTWNKIKELDLPEPDKNELDIPLPETVTEDQIQEVATDLTPETVLPKEKITKHKNKMLSDEEYREKIANRLDDLITKIESGETKLEDLTEEDQKAIIEIINKEE